MKLRLAVIYGSRTCEHDVSIISALQAMDNANPDSYEIIPVYVTRDGLWYTGESLRNVAFYSRFDKSKVRRVIPAMGESGKLQLRYCLEGEPGMFNLRGWRRAWHKLTSESGLREAPMLEADVAMPIMHGMNGEDGTLQGMLELFNVPYTSTGVLGSALGMDKIAMKLFFKSCDFPVLDGEWLSRNEWENQPKRVLDRIEACLSYPVYVKPANLGSSIGISRADDRDGLKSAIDIAVQYDRRVLVEQGVESPIEVNCAVLGYGGDEKASVCEMPAHWQEFLTFEDKYLRGSKGGKSQGMKSLSRQIPAPIGDERTREVQQLAIQVFRSLDCKGVVRIDFMIDGNSGKLYVNEINVIPGSLAFYLWEPLGILFPQLLDRMVESAFQAHAEKNKSVFSFDSTILQKVTSGAKGAKLQK